MGPVAAPSATWRALLQLDSVCLPWRRKAVSLVRAVGTPAALLLGLQAPTHFFSSYRALPFFLSSQSCQPEGIRTELGRVKRWVQRGRSGGQGIRVGGGGIRVVGEPALSARPLDLWHLRWFSRLASSAASTTTGLSHKSCLHPAISPPRFLWPLPHLPSVGPPPPGAAPLAPPSLSTTPPSRALPAVHRPGPSTPISVSFCYPFWYLRFSLS